MAEDAANVDANAPATQTRNTMADVPPLPITDGEDSLEDLRSLLWRHHKVTVGEDDPVLLVHTIHRAALQDIERMLDGQARRFSDAGEALADNLATDVTAAIEELKSRALTDALRERLATVHQTAELTTTCVAHVRTSVRQLRWLTFANYLAVAFSLGVLSLLIF